MHACNKISEVDQHKKHASIAILSDYKAHISDYYNVLNNMSMSTALVTIIIGKAYNIMLVA